MLNTNPGLLGRARVIIKVQGLQPWGTGQRPGVGYYYWGRASSLIQGPLGPGSVDIINLLDF